MDTENPNAPPTASSRGLFIATILTGSFLLFLVQPMIARMALPRLGGAPAVWNSAMLVYQALLLGGYAYAHRLSSLAPRKQASIHIGMLLLAALWLPLGLANFQMPSDGSPVFWVPWLLVASIGPLFFVVAAQAPLMQRWFNLAGNEGEPYALYAASNIGSFSGLIAYPLIVEPLMPIRAQNYLWTAIYVVLVVIVAVCARVVWRNRDAEPTAEGKRETTPIAWKRRFYWILLAAVPSGLMLSTTTHLTTDLVAMPLIWVLPLGLYLLSFTVAFADNRTAANAFTTSAPAVVLIGAMLIFTGGGENAIVGLFFSLFLLFVAAVALHSEMYRTRPEPKKLTEFYLMMSVGGVIGGLFCAIFAPLIFDWTWEHPILVLAAALLLPQKRLFPLDNIQIFGARGLAIVGWILALVGLGAGIYAGVTMPAENGPIKAVVIALLVIIGIMSLGNRIAYGIVIFAMMFTSGGWYYLSLSDTDVRMRSYFGTYRVIAAPDGRMRWLSHGTTIHGIQVLDDPKRPTSYYGAASGVGLAMAKADEMYGTGANIGVVGLGTGTLACYATPGQSWEFFEIDPLVVDIARDRQIFSFLSRCTPNARIELGDARLTLAKVKPGSFDILAIDAFSSDAIPLHLMTKEAFAIYGRALKPDGLLLVHISNRSINLRPVVAAQADIGGWKAALREDSPPRKEPDYGDKPSNWIALSRDPNRLNQLTGTLVEKKGRYYDKNLWLRLERDDSRPWTDDYASVLPHLSVWKRSK